MHITVAVSGLGCRKISRADEMEEMGSLGVERVSFEV